VRAFLSQADDLLAEPVDITLWEELGKTVTDDRPGAAGRAGSQVIRVKPDAVRVSWWYRAIGLDRERFQKNLGRIFIPSWVQIMAPLGLTSYFPTAIPEDACPDVPDETAIVFFESQEVYNGRRDATGGRLAGYALHQVVFDMSNKEPPRVSYTGWPVPMGDAVAPATSYHLFDDEADWFHGVTDHFVGVRPDALAQDAFLRAVHEGMSALRERRPEGLEGLLFGATPDVLMVWAHWDSERPGREGLLANLKKKLRAVLDATAQPAQIPQTLADAWPGLDVRDGDAFDARFIRRKELEASHG
jgi:hypothetical protein